MDEDRTTVEDDIRAAGLRCTAQRAAVLERLRAGGHQRVGDVTTAVAAGLGTVSVQAVYDALEALTAAGLAHRLEPAGSPALYEAAGAPHHHLVCRRCGAVTDVDLRHRPDLVPVDDHGYAVDAVELTFWGTCPACTTQV